MESWRMYMADIGCKPNEDGKVDVDGFIHYRTAIELKRPLAHELELLGIGFLPKTQKIWAHVKFLIDELYTHRKVITATHTLGPELNLEDLGFLLANLDMTYSRHEIVLYMIQRGHYTQFIKHLMRKFMKLNYGHSPHRFADFLVEGIKPIHLMELEVKDVQKISVPNFIAWLLADHPVSEYDPMYLQLIRFKYQFFRLARRLDQISRHMFVTTFLLHHIRQNFTCTWRVDMTPSFTLFPLVSPPTRCPTTRT